MKSFASLLRCLTLTLALSIGAFKAFAWQEVGGSASNGGISNLSGDDYNIAMVLDQQGNPIIAWRGEGSGMSQIYIKRWSGAAWVEFSSGSASGDGFSQDTVGVGATPGLCVDSQNRLWIAWIAEGKKLTVSRWNGLTWDSTQIIQTALAAESWTTPSIAVDSSDLPVLAAAYGNFPAYQMHVYEYSGVSWSERVPLIPEATNHYAPCLRYSASGELYLALTRGSYNGTTLDVYVDKWTAGAWTSLGNVSGTTNDSYWPQLAFDSSNQPIVCWMHQASSVHNI